MYQLALDRTGRRLATCATHWQSNDVREIEVWDTTTGRPCLELQLPNASTRSLVNSLALSPDGEQLAVGDYRRKATGSSQPGDEEIEQAQVKIYDLARGDQAAADPRLTLPASPTLLTSLAFSPDGRLLAVAEEQHRIQIWDLPTRRPLHDRPLEGFAYQLAFSPDGSRLAALNRERLMMWDVPSGQEVMLLQGVLPFASDPGFNPQVAWSPYGRYLATSNWNRSISVWDSEAGESRQSRTERFAEAETRPSPGT